MNRDRIAEMKENFMLISEEVFVDWIVRLENLYSSGTAYDFSILDFKDVIDEMNKLYFDTAVVHKDETNG